MAFSCSTRLIRIHIKRYDYGTLPAHQWFKNILINIAQKPDYSDILLKDIKVSVRNFVYLGAMRPPVDFQSDSLEITANDENEDIEFYLLEAFFWYAVSLQKDFDRVIRDLIAVEFSMLNDFIQQCPWHPLLNHLKMFFSASEIDQDQITICNNILEDILSCYRVMLASYQNKPVETDDNPVQLAGIFFDEQLTIERIDSTYSFIN